MSQRELLKSVYPTSKKWASRVDKMSDGQVSAILIKMRNEGKVP
jgi:hypothetical protein